MGRIIHIVSLVLLWCTVVAPAAAMAPQSGLHTVPPTDIHAHFHAFWERHGGIAVFGLPVTPPQTEMIAGHPVTVQWYERARFEWRGNTVELGRIGAELLQSYGIDWWTLPQGTPQAGCHYFESTHHTLCGPFLQSWQAHPHALTVFGAPISEPRWELHGGTTASVRLTQWFERARFELDTDVVFGSVGMEVLSTRTPPTPAPAHPSPPAAPVPPASPTPDTDAPPRDPPPADDPALPTPDFDTNGDGQVTCADFATQAAARAALAAGYDNLDRDNDGIPCESLPAGP
jgi:hypothetical protein